MKTKICYVTHIEVNRGNRVKPILYILRLNETQKNMLCVAAVATYGAVFSCPKANMPFWYIYPEWYSACQREGTPLFQKAHSLSLVSLLPFPFPVKVQKREIDSTSPVLNMSASPKHATAKI